MDLAATVRLVSAELAPSAARDGIRLDLRADGPLVVPGDPVLLRHLLTNLVRNAVQYNHPDGHVLVLVRCDASTVTVANSGPRIPADRIPELFEPFHRLDGDRTASSGHGLGLSIAASIAQAHHATLTADPGPEGGLALTLAFRGHG